MSVSFSSYLMTNSDSVALSFVFSLIDEEIKEKKILDGSTGKFCFTNSDLITLLSFLQAYPVSLCLHR